MAKNQESEKSENFENLANKAINKTPNFHQMN
jgi:hypothetical protein